METGTQQGSLSWTVCFVSVKQVDGVGGRWVATWKGYWLGDRAAVVGGWPKSEADLMTGDSGGVGGIGLQGSAQHRRTRRVAARVLGQLCKIWMTTPSHLSMAGPPCNTKHPKRPPWSIGPFVPRSK